jgi:hypothetical protein
MAAPLRFATDLARRSVAPVAVNPDIASKYASMGRESCGSSASR